MLEWLVTVSDFLWSYLLVALLLGCALLFTLRSRFVQFGFLREMFRLLGESTSKSADGQRHISSFEAFVISLASRIGTGNLAGVATALFVGGPGAVFWMWLIALLGAATAFVESTLAQLYKVRGKDSFVGGPAYYIRKGLKKPWMASLFAALIIVNFAFAFNSVQSNTICAAFDYAFGISPLWMGIVLVVMTLLIIFGGVQRIAKVSSVIVPFMALGYIVLALVVIVKNIGMLPDVLSLIFRHAFGLEQTMGGVFGVAVMQGVKRGLFSNEAGEGSTPNAAATATVSHPVKQGLIQALGVFSDTLVICSCTAFIILMSGIPLDEANGIRLTQQALVATLGPNGGVFVAVSIFFFAFSSILGNYYYGEANLRILSESKWAMFVFRLLTGGWVLFGALTALDVVWTIADITMALQTLCNLVALFGLSKYALKLLDDYRAQKRSGVKDPVFHRDMLPEIEEDIECWQKEND